MILRRKYEGQILAVVLVVMVVGVVIASAMASRSGSENITTQEENSSSIALETADTALDSVINLDMDDIARWANNPTNSVCSNGDPNYNFYRDGCDIIGLDELRLFLDHLGLLDTFYEEIESTMLNSCGYENASDVNEGFKFLMSPVTGDTEIDVLKDQVFSIILRSPDAPSCDLAINTRPGGTGSIGVIYTPIYATMSGSEIGSYKEYDPSLFYGLCLTDACNNTWGLENWEKATNFSAPYTHTNNFPIGNGSDRLYELRIRAVGDKITFTRDFNGPCDDVPKDDMMAVSVIIICNGESRGKEFILTKETWAPAIFDYVLFNGNGDLKIQ